MFVRLVVMFCMGMAILASCRKLGPKAPEESNILDGPVEGLTPEQNARFVRGDIAFNDKIFTAGNGLGPIFVATSCGACHAGDGKGHPFTTLTRFGQTDSTGNKFLHAGGPQLQNRAIPGYVPEELPPGATSSRFLPPANTGLGYLETVPDEDILAMADPFDADNDGISGVPNWEHIPSYIKPKNGAITRNGKYICRFGKKSGAYNLLHQTVNAYNQDMGITSLYAPVDPFTGTLSEPEVSAEEIHDVVFYLQTLKAPVQRNARKAQVQRGKALFKAIGCEKCHRETLRSGPSDVAALDQKEFHPYTDLLLHDMGPELDDGYTEGTALTSEWRTPPLWGLGLSKNSQGGQYYLMHDGRAKSIEEAILLHGGEGKDSRAKYRQLTDPEKAELIEFLESL